MTEYGVTDDGFVLKRTADIIEDLKTDVESRFPGIKTDGESLNGNLLGVFGAALGQAWEGIQAANNQYDPAASRGANLSTLVLINGLIRKDAEASTVTLTLTGTPATFIPSGSLVSNVDQSITVATNSDVTIGSGGSEDVAATATETGPLTMEAGDMTNIVTPVTGWTSVTNSTDGIDGRDTETDIELRERQIRGTFTPATSIVEAIYSNLVNLDGVEFVRVYINETGEIDSRGITDHSAAVVIVGGIDEDIAEIIFNETPAGINTYGSTEETVIDVQDFAYPIRFTRPTGVQVFVDVEVDTDDTFPTDGIDQIKQAIVDYAAGGADAIGQSKGNPDGFPPGAEIARSRIYTPCNSIVGHNVTKLRIGKTLLTLAEADIAIEWDEVSTWSTDDITVTVVG
jgi:uncharacterized phage protein gp47/JayE